jgi:hypothetical protein
MKKMLGVLVLGVVALGVGCGGAEKKPTPPAESKPAEPTCKVKGEWTEKTDAREVTVNLVNESGTIGKGSAKVGERMDDVIISGSASVVDAVEDKKSGTVKVVMGSLSSEDCAMSFNDACDTLTVNCKGDGFTQPMSLTPKK